MSAIFTAPELAAELGRSVDWLLGHRAELQAKQRMPLPLPGGPPLVWDRAQIYAWKDRALSRELRIAAMAFRAAEAAARNPPTEPSDQETTARARLDSIYAGAS